MKIARCAKIHNKLFPYAIMAVLVRVTKFMVECYDILKIRDRKLRNYMVKYLAMMMTISSVFLIKSGSEENLEKKQELWDYLKNYDKDLYKEVNSLLIAKSMKLPGKSGRKIIIMGYKLSRKIYGFGIKQSICRPILTMVDKCFVLFLSVPTIRT